MFVASMKNLLRVGFLLMVGTMFLSTGLQAQLDTGTVTGTVRDSSNAVVSGADLTLTNRSTGISQKARSSGSGTYVFEAVPVGVYTLEAGAQGFKRFKVNSVEVHVQSSVTADVRLQVGSITEEVTVTSAAPLLQAEDASIGETITSVPVNDLPLNGRNWLSLAQLAPGSYVTTKVNTSPGSSGASPISENGIQSSQTDVRLNGVNNNAEVFGGVTVSPVPDAMEEFKVQAGDNSAEFGHSAGVVINAVLKSGTNRLKGDVWEYFRNEFLNANDYFSKQNGVARPEYRQNQFGGTLGGPVVIPHLYNGKDRTFFFVDYQRNQTKSALPFTDTIPTDTMRSSGYTNLQDLINGNKGTETDALGRTFSLGTIFDPSTTRNVAAGAVDTITKLKNTSSKSITVRDPFYQGSLSGKTDFTGNTALLNVLPPSRLDPNAIALLRLLPAPNHSGLQNNYFVNSPQNIYVNQYDVRVDHTFSGKDSAFGVFSRSNASVSTAQPFSPVAGGALQISFGTTQPVYLLAFSETHIFSPTFINEARAGFNHNNQSRIQATNDMMGLPAQYGIQGIPQVPNNGGLPTLNIGGFSAFGSHRFTPTLQTVTAQDYTDNVTRIVGRHSLKFGVQFDPISGTITQPANSRGNFTWNGQYSDIPNQNSNLVGIADYLLIPSASSVGNLGGLSSYTGSNYGGTAYYAKYLAAYAQDSWKLTPTLTLNLGLRWEYFSPYGERNGAQANFIMPDNQAVGATYYMAHDGCNVPRSASFNSLFAGYGINIVCEPGNTVNTAQKANFSPRVGVAYRVFPKVVVRAGYGIAYGSFNSVGYGGTLGTNYPFQYQINSPNTTSQAAITLANGQTATMENTFGVINLQDPTQASGTGLSLSGKEYNYHTPYTESLNLTTQYQFTTRDSIQIGYVGTLSRHTDASINENSPSVILPSSVNQTAYRPFPNLAANMGVLSPVGTSNYHSLQVSYEHRFKAGLTAMANYTHGKCRSIGSLRAQWLPGWDRSNDYTLCGSDAAHLVHVSGQYALPLGAGKSLLGNSGRLLNALVGGWQLNYIYTYQSGQPFNVPCATATTSDFGCAALLVPGQNPYAGAHNQTQWLNPAAFANPVAATAIGQTDYSPLGGRGSQVRGPSYSNLDSSLFKQFATFENTKLEFRLELFNTLNTPQFDQPGSLKFNNAAAFSKITSLRGDPRIGQLALKLYF
jgi:hypothetical protein